jgi:UDP-N-acetylmuramoylalanine--D-glutamate ligase
MSCTFPEFLDSVKNKNVSVVGVGISNTPVISLLAKAGANVCAYDKNSEQDLGDIAHELRNIGVKLVCGENYLDNLSGDIIIKTPGMRYDNPALVDAAKRGAVITSEMELFFECCPCKIIAVTGSDGKTTTTSLIYEMLRDAGYTVHLGGNIGRPLLPQTAEIKPLDIVVAELSSFQLQTMKRSADVAVVTNLSPNHLDVHKSMEEYTEAKTNIFAHQSENGVLIVNADNEITNGFAKRARGSVLKFSFRGDPGCDGAYFKDGVVYTVENGRHERLMSRGDILLRGDHNVENYMAAALAVRGLCSKDNIRRVALNFGGVRHRIEFVREKDGVKYYNDSIGSSPTRTTATLRSFDTKVILIAGGYDKHLPFDGLAAQVVEHVKALFLTGDTANAIKTAVEAAPGYDAQKLPIIVIDDFDAAVRAAAGAAERGDCVLLSPACASFDKFKNFEVRGDRFVSVVRAL